MKTNADTTSVGYVLSLMVADSIFMGGVMITDGIGMPLEFRYTDPVQATKLQRILYGDVLESYIQCDVIAANLVSKVEQRAELFITADSRFLPILNSAGMKALTLLPTHIAPLSEVGAEQDTGDGDFLLQLADGDPPMRVRLGAGADLARHEESKRFLLSLRKSMDPLEPLNRIESAVKMLWDEQATTLSQ